VVLLLRFTVLVLRVVVVLLVQRVQRWVTGTAEGTRRAAGCYDESRRRLMCNVMFFKKD
jgi:hypothetical protein